MRVRVTTHRMTDGSDRVSKPIEWGNSSDRRWLQNHTHWAMNNGATVTLSPESN